MKTNRLFMAFSAGKESTESGEFKRYIGVAPVKVLAVNPTKSEQEKLYNTTLDKDPEYVGNVNVNGKDVQNVRISFVVKTDEEKCGIDMTTNVTFFLQNAPRMGSQSGKYQIIDKYGRTAWATEEDIKAKQIPVYSNGKPANIDIDYRQAYVGEEELTNFIKNYLNIPNVQKYVDGEWKLVDNPSECEARLDKIADYFKGNFAELKSIISLQPNNKIKVMFGVRTSEDGKEYQAVYTRMTLKNGVSDYSRLDKDLQEAKQNGAYSTTEFSVCPIKEYKIEATPVDDLPTAPAANPWFN